MYIPNELSKDPATYIEQLFDLSCGIRPYLTAEGHTDAIRMVELMVVAPHGEVSQSDRIAVMSFMGCVAADIRWPDSATAEEDRKARAELVDDTVAGLSIRFAKILS
jgi:hypothetical protein